MVAFVNIFIGMRGFQSTFHLHYVLMIANCLQLHVWAGTSYNINSKDPPLRVPYNCTKNKTDYYHLYPLCIGHISPV